MIKGCATILAGGQCPNPGAKKVNCSCKPPPRLCPSCTDTHRCLWLGEIASDPKKLAQWKRDNAPEEAMTGALVDALNALPDIELAWQSRKRGGFKANDGARSVGDVTAIARDPRGLHVEVELKGSHKDGCGCDSCAAQRARAERINAYGLYVGPVRTVAQAVDGVRLGLARARGRSAA